MSIFWAIVFIVMLIIEIATAGLTTIWFCAGSIVSLILSFFNIQPWIQFLVFAVVSVALLVFTRPLTKKFFKTGKQKLNTDRVIGRKSIVLEEIDGLTGKGCVKIDGILWSARSEKEEIIAKDTKVSVIGIDGAKLIVAPVNEEEEK